MIRVYSQDEELLAVFANDGSKKCPYYDDELYEELNGISELTFSVPMDHPDAKYVVEENLVVIEDPDEPGTHRLFTIRHLEEIRDEDGKLYKHAECEEQAIGELNDEIITDRRPQDTTALEALKACLESEGGSRWQVGTVDATGNASTNFYYESRMSALQKILETWGMEVRFRVSLSGTKITGRYVDLFVQRGEDNGIRIEVGRNLKSIKRTVETDHIKTALYGRGKGEQVEETGGYGRRLTFADVVWSTTGKYPPDPVDKPEGQEWIGDPEALERWGYPNPDGTKRHRFGVYVNEEQEDPAALLQETWEELQRLKEPRVTYETTLADLGRLAGYPHYQAKLGDVVRVIDKSFNPPLTVEARVIKRRRSISDNRESELTLGNFKPEITDLIREIRQDVNKKIDVGAPISWLDTIMETKAREMDNLPGFMTYSPDRGLLVANAPDLQEATSAIEIRGGGFRISNKPIKKPDGTVDFEWRTFGDGNGFTADELVAGTLNADLVKIQSVGTDGTREITLTEGYFRSYFDGYKTIDVGGYHIDIYDHGQFDSNPERILTGTLSLAWTAGINDPPNIYSHRGIIVSTYRDFVALGRSVQDPVTGNDTWKSNFYANWTDKRTLIYGPPTTEADEYISLLIFADRRYLENTGSILNGPGIRIHRGLFDPADPNSYVASVQLFIGDSDKAGQGGYFQIYHRTGVNTYKQIYRLVPEQNLVHYAVNNLYLNDGVSSIEATGNSYPGRAIRLKADVNSYVYMADDGTFAIYSGDSFKLRFLPNNNPPVLQIYQNGTWKTVVTQ